MARRSAAKSRRPCAPVARQRRTRYASFLYSSARGPRRVAAHATGVRGAGSASSFRHVHTLRHDQPSPNSVPIGPPALRSPRYAAALERRQERGQPDEVPGALGTSRRLPGFSPNTRSRQLNRAFIAPWRSSAVLSVADTARLFAMYLHTATGGQLDCLLWKPVTIQTLAADSCHSTGGPGRQRPHGGRHLTGFRLSPRLGPPVEPVVCTRATRRPPCWPCADFSARTGIAFHRHQYGDRHDASLRPLQRLHRGGRGGPYPGGDPLPGFSTGGGGSAEVEGCPLDVLHQVRQAPTTPSNGASDSSRVPRRRDRLIAATPSPAGAPRRTSSRLLVAASSQSGLRLQHQKAASFPGDVELLAFIGTEQEGSLEERLWLSERGDANSWTLDRHHRVVGAIEQFAAARRPDRLDAAAIGDLPRPSLAAARPDVAS